jgi:FMN phosphatase YigB (HAD superfamily)
MESKMSEIDFIYFDLGNVILDFDHDLAFQRVAQLTGVSPDTVKAAIFDADLEVRFETGLVTADEFHTAFCQAAKCEIDQSELLIAVSDIFTPNRQIFPLIAQLRAVNFPIGILSNTCSAHWELVYSKFAILRQLFSPTVLSYEVNSMKPDRKIYQRAIEMAGYQARKCFFVDDKQENVDAASEAGMDAVRYQSVPQLIQSLQLRGVEINL